MGCAIIPLSSGNSQATPTTSRTKFIPTFPLPPPPPPPAKAIKDNFYFNQSLLSVLLYLDTLNPEDSGASLWILVFPHLNSILGQRVRDDGNPSAINHIIVVLFWLHSMQTPELSFFFSQCNNWPERQSLGSRKCFSWESQTPSLLLLNFDIFS